MRLLIAYLVFLHLTACAVGPQPLLLSSDASDRNYAVTLDLLTVEDMQLYDQLVSTGGANWFAEKAAYRVRGGFAVASYELVPMMPAMEVTFPPAQSRSAKRLIIMFKLEGPVLLEAPDGLTGIIVGDGTIRTATE